MQSGSIALESDKNSARGWNNRLEHYLLGVKGKYIYGGYGGGGIGMDSQNDYIYGAGGGTTYERMFLGLPSIVTTTAENQVASIRYMSKNGLVWWVGNSEGTGASPQSPNPSHRS